MQDPPAHVMYVVVPTVSVTWLKQVCPGSQLAAPVHGLPTPLAFVGAPGQTSGPGSTRGSVLPSSCRTSSSMTTSPESGGGVVPCPPQPRPPTLRTTSDKKIGLRKREGKFIRKILLKSRVTLVGVARPVNSQRARAVPSGNSRVVGA